MIGEGVLSTPADEFAGQMTPDGQTIYFNRSIPRSVFYAICVSHRKNGKWTRPEIAPFSGHYRDADPVLSPDGKRLYFASDRPKPGQREPDYDIWVVELTGPRANIARRVEGAVNSDGNEYFASEASDGTLYVASSREGGIGGPDFPDIYRVPRVGDRYPTAENLGEPVNRKGVFTIETLIAPDQSFMIIGCFGHPAGKSDSDLFVTKQSNGKWSEPESLPVNTVAREYSPRLTPDGASLVFTSEQGTPTEKRDRPITYDELVTSATRTTNGLGNLYSIPLRELGIGGGQ
jgi:Tol biopolymer transport system component